MIDRWNLSVARYTELDADGFVGVQIDAYGGDSSGMAPFELYHQFGFAALPKDPDSDGKGCALLHGIQGDQGFAWLGHDPRVVPLLPRLKKGGSMQYAAVGAFDVFDGDDGTKTVYVPIGTNKAHAITVGYDGNGDAYVGIQHADGMAITMLDKTVVVKNAAGDAYIQLDADGIILNGNTKIHGGLDAGGEGSLPLAKAAELVAWAAAVVAACATKGITIPPLAPSVTTTLTKGV